VWLQRNGARELDIGLLAVSSAGDRDVPDWSIRRARPLFRETAVPTALVRRSGADAWAPAPDHDSLMEFVSDDTALRVLVVDDDEDFLPLMAEIVREAGGEPLVCSSLTLATGPVINAAELAPPPAPVSTGSASAAGDAAPLGNFHEAKQLVIQRFEQQYAHDLVSRHRGNLTTAAREAGLDRKSLARLLARHALAVRDILDS
jgi:hypothetical protein